IERERIQELEPNINPDVVCALWAPVSGIVCPFELTLAAAENAVENGAVFLHSFEVVAIENNDDGLRLISQDGRDITAKIAVNAAGIYSDKVAALFGDESICIEPRRGQYMLLDKTSGDMANRVLFQCPTPMGKGILVTPTVHGNLLVGPSAEVSDRDDSATDSKTLCNVAAIAKKSIPSLNMREIITSFAGIRAHDKNDDFVIGFSKANPRLYNAAGIESPGLTSAPAIGEYAAKEIAEFLGATDRADFNPIRVKKTPFNKLSKEEQVARAKSDSNYGKIVCRCETVTRGDILCALRSPIPARNIDGIKRRVRPTMGRCQGGFCCSICAEILADELNIPLDEITKFGGKSKLLTGKIA
ncbi:MAG: FAD-dependent oxidoreductase, partial [Oscillospiraceae bacterium]|nr:FAD-dependent oxidoreductase [Oscillospiraceae bacterium]